MPLFHCTKCHHEWEGAEPVGVCDWCGAPGEIIAEKTPLEKMLDAVIKVREDHDYRGEKL